MFCRNERIDYFSWTNVDCSSSCANTNARRRRCTRDCDTTLTCQAYINTTTLTPHVTQVLVVLVLVLVVMRLVCWQTINAAFSTHGVDTKHS